MSQTVDAIYEGGVLKPLTGLHLAEKQQVRITVDDASGPPPSVATVGDDPLAGLMIDTGIADLAQHFDDYRFGTR